MSELSPNLALPYMLSGQAQKHVTHNEALERLDVLAQLALESFGSVTPPATPAAGEVHGIGAGATGAWAGQDGRIAAFLGGAWVFLDPQTGWCAWGRAETELRVWDGSAWAPVTGDMTNLEGLGIGASWDAVNRLAVAADATLFTHAGSGHQVKVNKAGFADTGSILYQTNWSGRAEMGLAGSDDFSIKVSDGVDWFEAMRVDHQSGLVSFPSGLNGTGSAAGKLGGQIVAIYGERNLSINANTMMAMGNGSAVTAGAVMPFPGKILALGVSVENGTAGYNLFRVTKNKVETTADLEITYSGSGVQTAFADLSSAPTSFAAGDAIGMKVITAGGAANVVTTIYAVFD